MDRRGALRAPRDDGQIGTSPWFPVGACLQAIITAHRLQAGSYIGKKLVRAEIILAEPDAVTGQKSAVCRLLLYNLTQELKIFLAYRAGVCTLRPASGKDRLATAGSANRV